MTSSPAASWPTTEQLDDLVRRFQALTLPKEEWTHAAHLAVGTWHVHRYGVEDALARLRDGIRRLNDSHGTPNTDTSGYHETITRAYVCLIAKFLSDRPEGSAPSDRVRAVLSSPLAARDALFSYYSKPRLLSVAARKDWVEPDRRALHLPPSAPASRAEDCRPNDRDGH